MTQAEEQPLFELESKLHRRWDHLRRADAAAVQARGDLVQILEREVGKFASEDANLVAFGSLARKEWIDGASDLDWTYLVDGQAKSAHLKIAQQIRATLKKQVLELGAEKLQRFGEPGQTGTFGNLGFSHQLVHLIGGQDDTNKNLTQRMLLLLESTPIGSSSAYDRVCKSVIARYLEEESHLLTEDARNFKVPRFLLNDIVRFWRTMAVDFASKQRDRGGQEFGLRNAKLRMSRKLIFASGMLICFACHLDEDLQAEISTENDDINLTHLTNHIWEYAQRTPLDILALFVQKLNVPNEKVELLFDSYDEFIKIVSNPENRRALKNMTARESRDPVFKPVREISNNFNEGLNYVFFKNERLRALTEKYGVF
jgi:hypothetical protein